MDASKAHDAFVADRHKAEGKSLRPARPRKEPVTRKPLLISFGYFILLLVAIALMGPRIIGDPKPEASVAPRTPDTFGRSTVVLDDKKTCREILFDRATNEIIESVTGPCGRIGRKGASPPSLSQSQQSFSWGQNKAKRESESAARP